MNIKKQTKDKAIVLCGHGSRNNNYVSDFLNLKEKIKTKTGFLNIYHCFIEINQPSIQSCLISLVARYKKVLFFPLLLFDGKHMIEDIENQINSLPNNSKKKIYLINKLSLFKDILPNIYQIVTTNNYIKKCDVLITSCSMSTKIDVIKALDEYTKRLSEKLQIKTGICHFVGEEQNVLKKLRSLHKKPNIIILHPLFFFNGFLYKKNLQTISNYLETYNLLPLSHYNKIINVLSRKLIQSL